MRNAAHLIGIFLLFSCVAHAYIPARHYIDGRIGQHNGRYRTMIMALELMSLRGVKTIVETGTARAGVQGFNDDGSSTLIWADWARDNNAMVYSIDIEPRAIQGAREGVGNNNHAVFICADSVTTLENFDQPIDFLYLDSFDFNPTVDPNVRPCQEHHLKEIIAAYPKLHQHSVVMIDDCGGVIGGGKGGLVIPYLVERGWKLITNIYQAILVRE